MRVYAHMYKIYRNLNMSYNPNKEIELAPLAKLDPARFETARVFKQLTAATRRLGELKGIVTSIPNERILINALGLQEAKDSSAIENIVTTHDELYRSAASAYEHISPANKEVLRYNEALTVGLNQVRANGLLTVNHLRRVQEALEPARASLRQLPGTTLKNGFGQVIYTPPQHHDRIVALLSDLERFINDSTLFDTDPLIKMALIHHRFESIHPFYDGNGRTGRIANVLYLVKQELLDIPVLYLSRHIVRTKPEYYRLLQAVREDDRWESWVFYILTAVEKTAADAIRMVKIIRDLLLDTKQRIRAEYPFYSQDLINNLFSHPYTKIDFICRDLNVTRATAAKYLEKLVAGGFLHKVKIGRSNYYINRPLFTVLAGQEMQEGAQ